MRSKQQTGFESGIISMSGYLAEISKTTESINKLVQRNFNFSDSIGTSKQNKNNTAVFNTIRKYQGIGNKILRNIELYSFGSLDVLIGISNQLDNIQYSFKNNNNQNNQNKQNLPKSFTSLISNIESLNVGLSETTKSIETLVNLKFSEFGKLLNTMFSKNILQGLKTFVQGFKNLNKELAITEKYLPILNTIKDFNGKLVVEDNKKSGKLPILVSLGLGITALAVGLTAMNYVNWGSIFKLTTFIVALGGALAIFLKLGGKGDKIDTSTFKSSAVGLFKHSITANRGSELMHSIGIGVILIATALVFLKDVDWKMAAALGAFIIGLTLALTLYSYASNKKIIGGKRQMPPMFALSVGLAVLVLAISAAGEINWNGALPLLSFIIGLGVALAIMNKLSVSGSGKNKIAFGGISGGNGFIGFAIGLAIMALTVESFNDVSWKGAFVMIAFIIALGLAMKVSQGGKPGSSFNSSGMFGFSVGLAIIVLTIDAMAEVSWVSAFKLLAFIAGLGLAMRALPKGMWIGKKGALWSLGFSLLLFTGSLWLIGKMNIDIPRVVSVLGLFAISALAVHAFNKLITTKGAGMFLIKSALISAGLFVLGFGLATVELSGKSLGNGLMKFGIATLGILGLVILPLSNISINKSGMFVITSLSVSAGLIILSFGLSTAELAGKIFGSGLMKFGIASLAATALVIAFSKLRDTDLIKFPIVALSISIGLIILSIGLFTASNFGATLSIPGFTNVLISSGIAAAILIIFSKISLVDAVKFILVSVAMGLGLFLLSYSVDTVSNTKVNFANIGLFALSITIFAGIFFLLGLAIPYISIGIVGAIIMSIGLILIKKAIDTINEINVQPDKITVLSDSLIGICLLFAKISIYAIPAIIGAVLIVPVLVVSIVAGGLLMLLSIITITPEKLQNFKVGLYEILSAFNQFGLVESAKILLKAIAITPVVLLSVLSASVLSLISNIEINPKSNEGFKLGVKSIVEAFNQFGLVESAKVAAKSLLLLPVMLTGLAAAYIMEKISKIELSGGKMTEFVSNVDLLVDTMVDSVNRSQGKLSEAGPGIEALLKLTSIGTNLVDIMVAMANGTYVEYGIKDGKIVPLSVKQINYAELSKKIGGSFANLIMGLTDSLNAIDDSKATWKIGGISITNPFKGKNDSKLKAIEKLGNAFLPLTDIIRNLASIDLLQNKEFMNNFNTGLGNVIGSIVSSMQTLNDTEFSNIDNNIARLGLLTGNIDKLQKIQFDKYNNGISVFMSNLSDEGRWNRISANIDKTGTSISKIVKTINSIDLKKVISLEKTLQHLAEKNDSANLIKALNKVCDMIGSLRITQNEGLDKIKQILETGIVPNMGVTNNPTNSNVTISGSTTDKNNTNNPIIEQKQKTDTELLRERAIPVIIVNSSSEPIPVDDIENGISKALGSWNTNLIGLK